MSKPPRTFGRPLIAIRCVTVLVGIATVVATGCRADGHELGGAATGPSVRNAPTAAAERIPTVRPLPVRADGCSLVPALGIGFAVPGELVVTVAHVVRGATAVAVDGRVAEVLAVDLRSDVAVLRVAGLSEEATAFADAAVGDTVAVGVLRDDALTRLSATVERTPLIRFDEPFDDTVYERRGLIIGGVEIDAGDSGAPIVAADGRIVGMVFAASRSVDRAYAVDSEEIAGQLPMPNAAIVDTGRC